MRSKKTKQKGKAHVKGVQYIAKQLKHYQKKKYPSYNKALPTAREIFGKLKENKQDITLKNIWQYSRKHREKKKGAPILPDFLRQPSPYFDLLEYDYWIKRCPNDVFFESTLSPSTMPEIQGGETIDAEEYFLDFIRFCNILKSQTDPNESRYIDEWQVYCKEPVLINGKWISTIVCSNEKGVITNYGFDPDVPSAEPREPMPPREPRPEEPEVPSTPESPTPPTEPTGGADRAKEIKEIIEGFRKDLEKGYITKKTYAKLVSDAVSKLSKGGNL